MILWVRTLWHYETSCIFYWVVSNCNRFLRGRGNWGTQNLVVWVWGYLIMPWYSTKLLSATTATETLRWHARGSLALLKFPAHFIGKYPNVICFLQRSGEKLGGGAYNCVVRVWMILYCAGNECTFSFFPFFFSCEDIYKNCSLDGSLTKECYCPIVTFNVLS